MSFRERLVPVLGIGAVQTALYLWLDHHPPRPSALLPMTAVDRALPFLPWTVWAYLALLACEALFPLLVRERSSFRRLLVAYAIAMGVAFATYAVFPTRYPRPEASPTGAPCDFAWRTLVAIDAPECCLPSGHVIVPLLGAWTLARERRRAWPVLLVLLLVPSVITTRQHYVWDVLAALVLAALAWIASAIRRRPARGP